MSVSENYGHDFFEMHLQWRDDYNVLAEALNEFLSFQTVADLGCGNGFLIARLQDLGKAVVGVDGSEHAIGWCDKVRVADLTGPVVLGKHDLVICTEVAEHIAPEHADMLIENIDRTAKNLVFFSAALPGSGGYLHINERPKEYWLEKFMKRGFHLSLLTTDNIVQRLKGKITHTWWFAQHAAVYYR